MSLEIIQPGLLTTVQDAGRVGFQDQGIVVGGVMDVYSYRLANYLAQNFSDEAVLDISMLGPTIRFTEDHLVAVTGSDLAPRIDGERISLWKPVRVKAQSILSFESLGTGRYCYLAVQGGIKVPRVLGSYSTYVKAGLGGFEGRALLAHDVLQTNEVRRPVPDAYGEAKWRMYFAHFQDFEENPVVRVVKGPEWDLVPGNHRIFEEEFVVTGQSDRMGYKLQSFDVSFPHAHEIVSSAVTFGTIQVPPDGRPIVLMADRQTTGGYPRIGNVISVDLPKFAHVLPGKKVRFKEVRPGEAQELLLKHEDELLRIKRGLQVKGRGL